MDMLFKLSGLLILICSTIAYSQKDFRGGYIVNNQKDTIKGAVRFRPLSKLNNQIEFRFCNKNQSVFYSPDSILAFGFDHGKAYETRVGDLKGTSSFFQKLISGDVTLYKEDRKYFIKTDSLYQLNKENSQKPVGQRVVTIPQYIQILQNELIDCKTSLNFMQTGFNDNDLVRLLSDYHQCMAAEYKVFDNSVPDSKLDVYIVGGYSLVNFEILGERQFNNSNLLNTSASGLGFGLGVSIFSPRNGGKWEFLSELNFAKNKLAKREIVEFPAFSLEFFRYGEREINVTLPTLTIPIGLKHHLNNPRSSFDIGGGLLFKVYVNPEIYTIENNTPATKYEYNLKNLPNTGLWVGAGYSTMSYKGNRTFIDLRLNRDFTKSNTQKMISYSLLIGTTF
ncbi:MAG: hypothetical protein ABJH04_11745 [Cyclobacteriaceae bacterium]